MNKTVKYIIFLVLFVGVIALAVVGYNALSENYTPDEVEETAPNEKDTQTEADEELFDAPDFEMVALDGSKVKLSDLFDKPIILNFWATWCHNCVDEFPDFQEMYEKYGDEVNFVMLSTPDGYRETDTLIRDFIADNGYTLPIYLDSTGYAAYIYGANAIPATAFINTDGKIVNAKVGAFREGQLEEYIKELL